MKAYAGIGSRETPLQILSLMEQIAMSLSKVGFTLRSGYADGALTQKLEAYKAVSAYYAKALTEFKGNLVPQIVSGGGGAIGGGNSVMETIEMLKLKTARDLALDLTPGVKPAR